MSLSIIAEAGRDKRNKRRVLCRCLCGKEFNADAFKVTSGHTKSCGCLKKAYQRAAMTTHGQSRPHTPEYRAWALMKNRCLNPNDDRFSDYGGRGITVCGAWLSFDAFYADMGAKPSRTHSLDRKNNNGNYEPSNCRWATASEQNSNRRPYKHKRKS